MIMTMEIQTQLETNYKRALKEGYKAGYNGRSAINCPYATRFLRNAWLDGHKGGILARQGNHNRAG